jgi:hypothetical protein
MTSPTWNNWRSRQNADTGADELVAGLGGGLLDAGDGARFWGEHPASRNVPVMASTDLRGPFMRGE